MSGITLKIDKGHSPIFTEIMNLAQCFEHVKECKGHYSVKVSEEEAFRHQDQLQQIIQLLPALQEKEWFNIPDYGTDAWADWMIDLHQKKKENTQRNS